MSILSIKAANKQIKLISVAGKKLDERIHHVAVSGLAHFLQHGDTTLISELVHAMPRSGRGNALKFWLTKHLRIKWNAKAHAGRGGFVKNGEMDLNSFGKIALVMQAEKEPFYLKEDKEASVWNDKTAVLHLVKKLQKHAEEHTLCEESQRVLAAFA